MEPTLEVWNVVQTNTDDIGSIPTYPKTFYKIYIPKNSIVKEFTPN